VTLGKKRYFSTGTPGTEIRKSSLPQNTSVAIRAALVPQNERCGLYSSAYRPGLYRLVARCRARSAISSAGLAVLVDGADLRLGLVKAHAIEIASKASKGSVKFLRKVGIREPSAKGNAMLR
jgi:hypothetical protein